MSVQGVLVAVLGVLAAAYVFRSLAPRRGLWKLGIGRGPGGGTSGDRGAAASGGSCGCNDCPSVRKRR